MTTEAKDDIIEAPLKVVAIPIAWMLYSLPSGAFEIMGAAVQNPPLIVAEALVESGQGKRLRKIETGIETEEMPEETSEGGPWFSEE